MRLSLAGGAARSLLVPGIRGSHAGRHRYAQDARVGHRRCGWPDSRRQANRATPHLRAPLRVGRRASGPHL